MSMRSLLAGTVWTELSAIKGHWTLVICIVLSALVLLPAALYINELGFYSDDWAFMAQFIYAQDQSLLGLFRAIYLDMGGRPVQALYLASLFWLFGLAPLGSHLVNHGVFLSAVIVFYLCLKKLGLPYTVAVTWPVVFVTLPHYSTDRLWVAAGQANLSVSLYFISLYAGLEAVSANRRWLTWRLLSLVSMAISLLAYEVIAPFFALNLLCESFQRKRQGDRPVARESWGQTVTSTVVATCIVIGFVVWYKIAHTSRNVVPGDYGTYLHWLVSESLTTNYVKLGVALPQKFVSVLQQYATPAHLLAGISVGILVFTVCFLATSWSSLSVVRKTTWLMVATGGLGLSLVGYGTFLTTSHIGFTETGVENRTAIVAALGVALSFVGLTGLSSSLLPMLWLRQMFFCLGITFFCVTGSVINTTVASFWVAAAQAQRSVIQSLFHTFPQLPPRTTVLLDGFCPYIGPGIVFETAWDVSGMLQIHYRDPSLKGDVVTSKTVVDDKTLATIIYGDTIMHYPYADTLLVYDVERQMPTQLLNVEQARRYFSPPHQYAPATCVEGRAGAGAPIF